MPRDTNFRPAPVKTLVEQFADWVSEQDPEREYNFWSIGFGDCGCAITQFFEGTGRDPCSQAWHDLHHTDAGRAVCAKPRTFGALSDRLKVAV